MNRYGEIHKGLESLSKKSNRRLNRLLWSIGAKCVLVGLLAGLLVSLYCLGIKSGTGFARSMYAYAAENPLVLIVIAIASVGAGLLIAWMVKKEPMASGSGIPQTEGVLSYVLRMKSASILAVRFAGGLLGAFFGMSLGRGGPCVQVGACSGNIVRKAIGRGGMEENCLITAGAAAGLSAAFQAPISGIVFALEEMHRSFSPFLLIAAATAALAAAGVADCFFGLTPVLNCGNVGIMEFSSYVWLLPLGVLSGLSGAALNKALIASQALYCRIPAKARPVLALLIVIPFGLFMPEVLGGGENLVFLSEGSNVSFGIIAALLLGKFVLTCTSSGCGAPGGIFMPILAIGALTGAALGAIASLLGMPADYVAICAVCGMAGTFASSVKAPLTGILLVVEMSGSLTHILPLAIVAFTAIFVSDMLGTGPIYNELLDRYIDANGKTYVPGSDPDRLIDEVVEEGSLLDGAEYGAVDWPDDLIVVRIQKAERAVMPRSTSRIRAEDHLIATPVGNRFHAKSALHAITRGASAGTGPG